MISIAAGFRPKCQHFQTAVMKTCMCCYSTKDAIPSADHRASPVTRKWRKTKKPPFNEHLSWEERLADAVTPLWRLSYDEQLELKQSQQKNILLGLSMGTSSQTSASLTGELNFPLLPVLPSPVRDGYRNKSTFSVNVGVDGNPKTVGFYVGTAKAGDIVCVNADHLLNMPERHKLVARCYQDFLRLSPLEPCLLFHAGGHWREVTVRTGAEGRAMAIVHFHPQTLTPEEIGVHKAALVEYFSRGPGAVCRLDSLYFQESRMTRCSHEESPYQLLHGQTHIHEEVNKSDYALQTRVLSGGVRFRKVFH